MKNNFKNIKEDLYKVFIAGEAKSQEIARVFVLIAIPLIPAVLMIGNFPKY